MRSRFYDYDPEQKWVADGGDPGLPAVVGPDVLRRLLKAELGVDCTADLVDPVGSEAAVGVGVFVFETVPQICSDPLGDSAACDCACAYV